MDVSSPMTTSMACRAHSVKSTMRRPSDWLSLSSKVTTVSDISAPCRILFILSIRLTLMTNVCTAGTMFAYGQTGCGKSHTMMGLADQVDENGDNMKGIIPKSVDHIFGFLDNDQMSGKKFLVRCAYLEIYNEAVLDLLSKFGDAGKGGKKAAPGNSKQESL